MMIDWLTAKIPFFAEGTISEGQILCISPDGEIEYSIDKRLPVVGSYESRVMIRTCEVDADRNTTMVELSGNLVKFIQGHNVFGTTDLLNLVAEGVLKLSDILQCPQPENTFNRVLHGAYYLSRVDINELFWLGDQATVNAVLHSLGINTRTRSHSALMEAETVYWNKSSKRHTIKAYNKYTEVLNPKNKKPGTIELPPNILEFLKGIIRIELVLKRRELADHLLGLNLAANWANIEESAIFYDYVGRINMNTLRTTDELVNQVKSNAVLGSYLKWKSGIDLRATMSKTNYYKHRNELLKHGVDISIPYRPDQPTAEIIPFVRHPIEFKPAPIPDWVYGTNLFFEPRKLCNA